MLEAQSVAVIGASDRPASFGSILMAQLIDGGYDGKVYPINPRYESVRGIECFTGIADLAEPVDLVLLGVANERLEEQMLAAAANGARSAVVFGSGVGTAGDGARLSERLAAIAADSAMELCGGNGMGFINFRHRLRACGYFEPLDLPAGDIAFVTHSGSLFSAVLHARRLRIGLAVSSGQEWVTTIDQYLSYALAAGARTVGLFVEGFRRVEAMAAALDEAADLGVPVVVLDAGRTEHARELVAAHSGAIAGSELPLRAYFEAHGALMVDTIAEFVDTVELFGANRAAGPGGLASVHDSGGERAHFADVAARTGVEFAEVGAATLERMQAVLEPGLAPANPLDAWGTGHGPDQIFLECLDALAKDEEVAAVVFAVDLTTEDRPDEGYPGVAVQAATRTSKPFAVLSNLASAIDPASAQEVRTGGVPLLEGTDSGLRAVAALFEWRDRRNLAKPSAASAPAATVNKWRDRLQAGGVLHEVEALDLLADYGVQVVRHAVVESETEAVAAAEAIGFPVVMKSAAEILHKSEVGGVRLNIGDRKDAARAYRDLADRLGPGVIVAATAAGVELGLGLVQDPLVGSVLLVAAGGTLVEVLEDRAAALPPIDEARAVRLISRLRVGRLVEGTRGRAGADPGAIGRAMVGLSNLACDLGDLIAEMDVNPLLAGPEAAIAVDALVIPTGWPRSP
jgi:acyl-CoA synthetase (NDP forming)